jgi:alkyldihydroxyacetonephosphate synthase
MVTDHSYRHILKWGDKHEETIDHLMLELVRRKFDLDEEDINTKYLPGTEMVRLDKPSMLKPGQLEFLKSIVGEENILTDDFSRAKYSCGKFYGELLDLRLNTVPDPPDAVISPKSHEEVVKIIRFCNEEKIPVIPSGGRSSVTGALRAPEGGIALDLTKHLNGVIRVNAINKTVTVQTGIMGPQLEEELNRHGYSCGHFPQAFEYSTVGGWIAARGAGQASTGYGKIEDMVVALKVVTPAGVIETKEFPRTAQGWDIFRLFAGSEGT